MNVPSALLAIAIVIPGLAVLPIAIDAAQDQTASFRADAFAPNTDGTALYDNFGDQEIDPSRWHGVELVTGPSLSNLETARRLIGNRLQLLVKTYGMAANKTANGSGDQRLRINNPTPVHTFQAGVIVRESSIDSTGAPNAYTSTGALITGHFFNDGSSRGPGDETGDIIAHIGKFRDIEGRTIRAFIGRCVNATCSSFVAINAYEFDTTWKPHQHDTLRFAWEPGSNRFVFAVNPGTRREEIVPLSYTVPDTLPPGGDRKELRVQNTLSISPYTATTALMRAEYDNVRLNPEAIP